MKKRLLAVVMIMVMACMMLTGCAKIAPADQTIDALFDLYVKDNALTMKDVLGFKSEEDVKNAFMKEKSNMDMVKAFKSELQLAGVSMSDEDFQNLTDAILGMLAMTSCTAEVTGDYGDLLEVTLWINGYSDKEINSLMKDAENAMIASISEADMLAISDGDMDLFKKYMSNYINDFISGIAELQPLEVPVEVIVDCEKKTVDSSGKEITAWLPIDMKRFMDDVEAAVFQ